MRAFFTFFRRLRALENALDTHLQDSVAAEIRVDTLMAERALHNAEHMQQVDALSRLFKRVSMRIARETPPPPVGIFDESIARMDMVERENRAARPESVLEMKRRLRP